MEVDDLDNIEDADLEEIIFRFLEEDPSILELDEHQCFTRERPPKTDYWTTAWGRMLLDPLTRLGYTRQAKNFRRRFRIPLQLFNHIVERSREANLFGGTHPEYDRMPIEFKILMALRILGRRNCADDIAEMSTGYGSSINHFFRTFVEQFSKLFYSDYVHVPEGNDLQRTMDSYAELGIPGGVGSMNATHLPWDKCPVSLYHLCKGKEKFPTLAFNCVVDHFKFIHYCSDAFFGATNDLQICADDDYPVKITQGLYRDVEYDLYRADGSVQRCRGAYIICDGGMPKHACFMDPMHHRSSRNEVLFSEWLESVRKDVECTFGILKQRFRYLRNKIQHHSVFIIQAAMKTCCMLHNMLLHFDGKYFLIHMSLVHD
jgi:hypothetical protein